MKSFTFVLFICFIFIGIYSASIPFESINWPGSYGLTQIPNGNIIMGTLATGTTTHVSTDGGNTFNSTRHNSDATADQPFYIKSSKSLFQGTGWYTGGLYRSIDGGLTWETVFFSGSGMKRVWNGVQCKDDPNHVVIGGHSTYFPAVLHSYDGGRSFDVDNKIDVTPTGVSWEGSVRQLIILDDGTLVATVYRHLHGDGLLTVSKDHGFTWETKLNEKYHSCVTCYDNTIVCVGGELGFKVASSTDNGNSFSQIYYRPSDNLYGVGHTIIQLGDESLFACGGQTDSSPIKFNANCARSYDMGHSWTLQLDHLVDLSIRYFLGALEFSNGDVVITAYPSNSYKYNYKVYSDKSSSFRDVMDTNPLPCSINTRFTKMNKADTALPNKIKKALSHKPANIVKKNAAIDTDCFNDDERHYILVRITKFLRIPGSTQQSWTDRKKRQLIRTIVRVHNRRHAVHMGYNNVLIKYIARKGAGRRLLQAIDDIEYDMVFNSTNDDEIATFIDESQGDLNAQDLVEELQAEEGVDDWDITVTSTSDIEQTSIDDVEVDFINYFDPNDPQWCQWVVAEN